MFVIRKAAVLGAGRMGTAVAAQLANAGIPTLLLDLAPTKVAETGIATAVKGRPAAFAHPSRVGLLTPGNFDDDLGKLRDVDWVVEAVVERLDIKTELLRKVAANIGDHTIVTTNSSGLSVNDMAAALPDAVKPRFFGTHFFFPPRYMYLLELIPGAQTDRALMDAFRGLDEDLLGAGLKVGPIGQLLLRGNEGVRGMAGQRQYFCRLHLPGCPVLAVRSVGGFVRNYVQELLLRADESVEALAGEFDQGFLFVEPRAVRDDAIIPVVKAETRAPVIPFLLAG